MDRLVEYNEWASRQFSHRKPVNVPHWSTHNRSFRSNAQSYSEPGCRPCLKRSQPLLPNTGTARRGSWGRVRRERSVPPSSSREILHVRTPAQPSRRLGRQPSPILRNVLFFLLFSASLPARLLSVAPGAPEDAGPSRGQKKGRIFGKTVLRQRRTRPPTPLLMPFPRRASKRQAVSLCGCAIPATKKRKL